MSRILRRAAVEDRTGYPTSTLYDKIKKGKFPKPVQIGPRAVGWVESEVDDHIAAQIAARDVQAA